MREPLRCAQMPKEAQRIYTPVLKQWAVRDLSGDYLTAKSGTAQPEVLYATLANASHTAFPDLAIDNFKSATRRCFQLPGGCS